MKLSYLVIVLLAVSLTQQNNFVRNQHTTIQNHQIFENSWAGTSNSQCDNACKNRNYKVCGTVKKQCCRADCKTKWFGTYQYCQDGDTVQDLVCSVIASVSGGKYWTGDTCNIKCNKAGGIICGSTNKQCCEEGCDKGTFTESCKDSKTKEFNCTAATGK